MRLGKSISEINMRLQTCVSDEQLPYIARIHKAVFPGDTIPEPTDERPNAHCYGVLTFKVNWPCLLELIWAYWHEEEMLGQTLNAISRRFQNIRGRGDGDPLAHLEINPLRPLNNLLWGYIQDEQNRLTVNRRASKYDLHYGIPSTARQRLCCDRRAADPNFWRSFTTCSGDCRWIASHELTKEVHLLLVVHSISLVISPQQWRVSYKEF